ncbi:unnamed protein product [Coregonus sp. 'balchen']|nr:unnamed protein product [Coregonus sp. 'balchen']
MGVANSRDHHPYHPSQSPIKVVLKRRNEPLKKERPKWKNEYPMTEGQLRSKRDEFWETAPAFDGRKEIWDALRAAAVAAELNDVELAQAITLDCRSKDLRISASMSNSISQLKRVLEGQEDIEAAHQRWFFAGKLLTDKTRLKDTKIQKDFVVQVIVNNYSPVTRLISKLRREREMEKEEKDGWESRRKGLR